MRFWASSCSATSLVRQLRRSATHWSQARTRAPGEAQGSSEEAGTELRLQTEQTGEWQMRQWWRRVVSENATLHRRHVVSSSPEDSSLFMPREFRGERKLGL